MAIQLHSTKDTHRNGLKIIVFGASGTGKTTLIKTLPNPIVLSAEAGLLSINDADIPYIEIKSMEALMDAYRWVTESGEAAQFESIALDSISEVGEVVLASEKRKNKDVRAAYGELQTIMMDALRAFRDIRGKHVYMSAKQEKMQDEQGRIMYSPSMPGAKLSQQLPYIVDECYALRVEKDGDGNSVRALMTQSDGLWAVKSRAKLEPWEAPDLGAIIKKMGG
jgi:phage nucleotide-binding protein